MNEILPNIFTWPYFSEEKGFNFNGHYVVTDAGAFLIDPVLPTDEVWQAIESRAVPSAIYLTNKDHTRKAMDFKERFNCPIWIHEADKDLVDLPMDQTFGDGQVLAGGFRVIQLADSKSPGESAFLLERDGGILIVGDAMIGNPPGELNLLPPAKIPVPEKAKEGLRKLLAFEFDALLLGDGQSFPKGGRQAVESFLAT